MKYLILITLFLTACNDKDRCEFGNGSRAFMGQPLANCDFAKRYKGALTWSVSLPLDKMHCEKGRRLIYPRINLTTNFTDGTQDAELGWQCAGYGDRSKVKHVHINKIDLKDLEVND